MGRIFPLGFPSSESTMSLAEVVTGVELWVKFYMLHTFSDIFKFGLLYSYFKS